jgi:hypothetical protein
MTVKEKATAGLRRRCLCLLVGIGCVGLLLVAGGRATAQVATGLAQVSNGYLRLVVDNISTDDPQGDFALMSTGGDPLTSADDSRILSDRVDPYPQDMRTTVAVDWTPAGAGQFLQFGSGDGGTYVQQGVVDSLRQNIVFEWEDSGHVLDMQETLTLLRDVLEMRYRLTNTDTVSHTYGLKVALDIRPNATDATAGANTLPESPLFVPGSGPITHEVKYEGGDVPDRWWCGVPTVQQATVMGGFLANFAAARHPDEFDIGNLANLQADTWNFSPATGTTVQDAGVAVRWNPVRLSPNESVEFVTYFGYASASEDSSSPFVLAAVAPATLTLKAGDNPNTPETEQLYVSPDPFQVQGYVYNVSDSPLFNVNLYLSLPDGLEFPAGETPNRLIDQVSAHSEKMVSWDVHATGLPAGTLTYLLSANATASTAKAVRRDIQVPPVNMTDLTSGWQMISIPLALADAAPGTALKLTPTAPLRIAWWGPEAGEYRIYPDSAFGVIQRGQGYWIAVDAASSLSLVGASPPGTADALVPLGVGWNQIGDPFELPIRWGRVQVTFQGKTMSLGDAVRLGLLRSTLFWWDPVLHEYRWSLDTSYMLQPWDGYWVKANADCALLFPRVETSRGRAAAEQEGSLQARAVLPGGWALELVATDKAGEKAKCVVGVSAEARDGYDSQDVEAPPMALGSGMRLSMPHPDWGPTAAGSYLQDMRQQKSSARWEVEVRTQQPSGDVFLSWPDLRGLPKDAAVYLEREDTGQRVSMRTSQGLSVNTGTAGVVRVAVVLGTAGDTLVVSTPQVDIGKGSLVFWFDLSMEAQVSATISNLAGTEVRRLASELPMVAGRQSLAWDARDEDGRRVPAGTYVLGIEALGWDGQRFVSSRTFTVQQER